MRFPRYHPRTIAIPHAIAVLCLFLPSLARAVTVWPSPYQPAQYFNASGQPLASGVICTYAAGTTTPLAAYTDHTGGTAYPVCSSTGPNPPSAPGIVLNAGGYPSSSGTTDGIWLQSGTSYKLVAYDSGGNLQWTIDGIINPPTIPAGSDKQVQFNQSGALGATGVFTYNYSTNTLSVPNISVTGTFSAFDCGNQVYSVKCPTFGAVGNGITNDASAFQAAITAASGAGGGKVYIPHPSAFYNIGSNVNLSSNVIIECEDQGTVLKAPSGGSYFILNSTTSGVSDVTIQNCGFNGNGNTGGIILQFQCSSNFRITNNIFNNGNAIGVDTNTPGCGTSSNNYEIDHNSITGSVTTAVADIQFGAGATGGNIHDNYVADSLNGQLEYDCDGCSTTKIHDNIAVGTGTESSSTGISSCYQVEASSANVADVQLQNNLCSNIMGAQAGIFVVISGTKSLKNILLSGNHVVNSAVRGEEVGDFAFSGSGGVVSDINIVGEHIVNTGSPTGTGLFIWHRGGGSTTFGNINVSGVMIDGCGSGDDNGCLVMKGSIPLSISSLSINTPSSLNCIYNDNNGNLVSIGGILCSGSTQTDFIAGTPGGGLNAWASLSGTIPLGGLPTRTSSTCNVPGAIATNSAGTSLATAGWICVSGSPNVWTAF